MTSSAHRTPAVFIDRDGVICENRADHVKSWSEFSFIPGAIEAVASLSRAGCRVFIVTNQGIVGRGLISRRQLDVMHEKMLDVLNGAGAKIDGIIVCPHHPDDRCACRKPEPGMLREAESRYNIDLPRSFMVGDWATDVDAGHDAGCIAVLVKTGRGRDAARQQAWKAKPEFIADDLVDAAIWILARRSQLGSAPTAEVRAR